MTDHSHHFHDSTGGPLAADPFPTPLINLRNVAGLVGVICLALLAIAAMIPYERTTAFRGLLFAYHFWLGISLGAMSFVMISHCTGGGWGVVYRRFGEAAFLNVPVLLVVAVLLAFGYGRLFPWARAETFRLSDPEAYGVLRHRQPWYTPTWFFVRQMVYFAIWGWFAYQLRTKSLRLDRGPDPVLRRRLRLVSAGGIVVYFVTTTSYAMDIILSRETNWYSSIIGFITAIEFGASGMALCTLSVCYFARRRPLRDYLTPQHLNDLGNLLLALVILWMYTSFAQLLIIWNGNTTGDIGYYTHRGMGIVPSGWRWVAAALVIGHFFIPFFLLLMKGLKRKATTLGRICVWLLIMRIVESLWVIAPSGPHRTNDPGGVYWTDVAAFLGVGGIWLFNYLRMLGTEALLPRNATDQPEVISHGTHAATAHAI